MLATYTPVRVVGTGVKHSIPFTFQIKKTSEIEITQTDTNGADTVLTLIVHYGVTGAGSSKGGTVSPSVAIPAGYVWTIRRVVALTQETDIRNQGAYYREIVEDALDKALMIDQQQQEQLGRSLKVSSPTVSPVLPVPEGGMVIGWKADKSGLRNYPQTTGGTQTFSVPVFADNAAALVGGMAINEVYQTPGGSLVVTHAADTTSVSVSVSPATASLASAGTQYFSATVSGSTTTTVTWAVDGVANGNSTVGTLSAVSGLANMVLYQAPATAGSHTITATSVADGTKAGSSTVTITAAGVVVPDLAAFPGAEGMGASATGGRGGAIYTVNSLGDTYAEGQTFPTNRNGANGATCTLRDALQAHGARTIVFSVSGTITLHGPIYPVVGDLTIAGQTSPGGIQVKGDGTFGTGGTMIHLNCNNVIVRYMRIRPGSGPVNLSGQGLSGFGGGDEGGGLMVNHIYDHCSFEWDGNKPCAWGGAVSQTTLSWNLFGEGMYTGPLLNGMESGQTYLDVSAFDGHHNVFAYFDHRIPHSNSKYFRWINNLTFGYNFAGLVRGNCHADIVGNVWDSTCPLTANPAKQEFRWADTFAHNESQLVPGGDSAQFYMSNNFGPHNSNGSADNFNTMFRIASNENEQLDNNVVSSSFKASAPASMLTALNTHPITVNHLSTYTDLRGVLSETVGAYQRLNSYGAWVANRDAVDARIIGYINNPATAPSSFTSAPGTYPTLSGSPYTSTANDGIADDWKVSHGLSVSDVGVANTVRTNANGYTNLELFLSGLYPNGVALP